MRPYYSEEWYQAELKKRARVRGSVVGTASTVSKTVRRREECSRALISAAGSNPAPSLYRSKWETQIAYELTIEKRAGLIVDYGYETMTLKLATGKRYTPDFTVLHHDGHVECVEVKGHHKNLRDSLTHIKWAAQLNPWFRFTIKRRVGQGWESEEVTT